MATIEQNLERLNNVKTNWRQTLINQGQTIAENAPLESYVVATGEISTEPKLQDKTVTITNNGTQDINADTNYDGLDTVTINTNVQPNLQDKSITITENGTTTISKDTGYDGLNKVEITTDVAGSTEGVVLTLDKTVSYTKNVNTSRVQAYTEKITGLDVSNETDLSYYLTSMYGLKECNPLNTTKATNMSYMFNTCVALVNPIQLSDTSNVTNMSYMFNECRNLKSINIDASAITTGEQMFFDCISLENVNINISNKITNMKNMFYNCNKLETISATQFDTSNVTNMVQVFSNNYLLKSIPSLVTDKVRDLSYAFQNCAELEEITITDTPMLTKAVQAFYNCKKLKRINGILDFTKLTSQSYISNIFGVPTADTTAPTLLEEIRIKNLRTSLNLRYLTSLSHDSLVYLINNLYDRSTTTTATLTLGTTNLAKLTEEEKAVATSKGWTLA